MGTKVFQWPIKQSGFNFMMKLVAFINDNFELQAFCDTSLSAYGYYVYLVSRLGGHACSTLLCLKSKVVTIKVFPAPTLVLCAAALLAQEICSTYDFNCPFFCWSDY